MKTMRERPLQIYLRPDQDTALRNLAEKEGVSIAELVRRGVDQVLTSMPIEHDPALGIIALGSSGIGDVAERHDYYLSQIYKDKFVHPRKRKSNGKRNLYRRQRVVRRRRRG